MSKQHLITTFYSAFQQKNYRTMAECYHPNAIFTDEVFRLKEKEIHAMWQFLCERGKDIDIIFKILNKNSDIVEAYWEATYTFGATGRKVQNNINSTFTFKDGKIIEHTDSFDFWKWSRQALGVTGLLLGWTPFLKKKVQKQAADSLNAFISRHPEYQ